MTKQKKYKSITIKTLENLGLTENEAVLYMILLNQSQNTVRELEIRAPFPRTMLYHVLKQLIKRNLVSASRSKVRTAYTANSPEHLYDMLANKEKEFTQSAQSIRELIPRLKNMYHLAGEHTDVRKFEGIIEYKKALEDIIISDPKKIFAYKTFDKQKPALEVRKIHEQRRIAKKIQKKVLFFETESALKTLANRKYDDFTEFKSVKDGALLPFNIDIMLFDNKVLYTNYYKNINEPTAVLIEDKNLFEMQKNLFKMLWSNGDDKTLYFTELNKIQK
jgi:sugar-specific transcriptional regulator TrmB